MKTRTPRKPFRATMDHLEDRRVLTAYGNPWADPTHLSLSFAPDGTRDAGQASALYQTMNQVGSTSAWQGAIVRAYQTWAANANLSIGLKPDGGQALGSPGAIQGDSRFGDIRIGAVAQGPGVLAVTQPFSYSGGTWAGDVNFNTADALSLDGHAGTTDLFTLALHEAGHSLGLPDSTDTASAMFDSYTGPRAGLASGDIAAIQALYGARQPDSAGNTSFATALPFVPASSYANLNASNVLVGGSLASPSDHRFYALNLPQSGSYNVTLATSGFSSLLARVTAYDSSYKVITSAVATNPTNGNLSLYLPSTGSRTCYISVQAAGTDVYSAGSFMIRALPAWLKVAGQISTDIYDESGHVNPDLNQNDSLATASVLTGGVGTSSILRNGSLTLNDLVDCYRFTTPASGPGVMTISAFALDRSTLSPALTLYDASNNPVAVNIMAKQAGQYVIQVPAMAHGSTYSVRVSSGDPSDTTGGNYGLAVQFSAVAEVLDQLGSGTLTPAGPGALADSAAAPEMTLTTDVNGIVHLILSADTGGVAQNTSVQLTIKDANGTVVQTLTANANRSQSLELWLAQGTYSLSVVAINSGTASPGPMKWSLYSQKLSDPMMSYGYVSPAGSTTTYPPTTTTTPTTTITPTTTMTRTTTMTTA
jgi:hypothetical protein